MARTLSDYRDLLLMLLPVGSAWSRESDGDLAMLCTGLAEELLRIDARAELLMAESLPSSVIELIGEWEQDWNLPDACAGTPESLEERRNVLLNKMRGIEDQSRKTYIDRAAQLGYSITITEFAPGEAIPGYPQVTPDDSVFFIQVNAPLVGYRHRRCGEPLGAPFATWVIQQLECALKQITQAHMNLIFSYT